MIAINTILVFVDPTADSHPCIDKAIRLAAQCGARVELFACETHESRATAQAACMVQGPAAPFIISTGALLEEQASALRSSGVDAHADTAFGNPMHAQLLERVKVSCADLVVKDTQRHSLAQRTFITNADWELIRGCAVPVLLTKAKPWRDVPIIAAAVDPAHADEKPDVMDDRIIQWCRLLSRKLGGTPRLLNAFVPSVLSADDAVRFLGMAAALRVDVLQEAQALHRALLEDLARPHGIDAEHAHLQFGAPSQVLLRLTRDLGVDVLVLGATSRSVLHNTCIGSTAEKVIEAAPCDLLVLAPPHLKAAAFLNR